ncbi:altered inheritance of mitochondria protein 32 [Mercurialis annua]|uniref:altered inheritance of mitochondria protein 32 n=1 Tax=Mercurialis annua TaxID=3986 RepID=UPI00215EAC11|nr:altered inheritance of mitochondria protein 32 [Mercurialis annua]
MRIAHPSQIIISLIDKKIAKFSSFKITVTTRIAAANSFSSMADSTDNTNTVVSSDNDVSTVVSAAEEDAKFGFTRPEMYQLNLSGTVNQYDRHVFLCFNKADAWLPRVEESQTDPLPKLLSSAVKARKDDITVKTLVTVCEGGEGTLFENGDVLIFPDKIKYKCLKESDVAGFVDDVLVNGKPWALGAQEVLTGSHVFVCAHASRDKRCGVCGPILITKLKEGIESRGLEGQVFVSACSHIGGHKYAGNLIIYSPESVGKIMGHWYGYVTPDDVPEILDQHISKGEVIERLWRGKMGALTEEDEKVTEEKLPNGKNIEEKLEESNTEFNKENVGGCCQGSNGFSCCRDGVTEDKKQNEISEVHEKKGQGKLSSWISSLEQSDVLAAVAVAGAVATIAVAYSLLKRSG